MINPIVMALDSEEFHTLCMNYRAASPLEAKRAFESLQQYIIANSQPPDVSRQQWAKVDGYQGVLQYTGQRDAQQFFPDHAGVYCIYGDQFYALKLMPPSNSSRHP